MTDRQTTFEYSIGFPGRSFITLDLSETFVVPGHPYDPTNTNGVKLPSGESFSWQSAELGFISDSRKLFTFSLEG